MTNPNEIQVGGSHYQAPYQHWDYVLACRMGYLEGNATKYVARWRKKNGVEDLQKARHYLTKLINVVENSPGYFRTIDYLQVKAEAEAFCRANDLNRLEAHFCVCMAVWQNLSDLTKACDKALKEIEHSVSLFSPGA